MKRTAALLLTLLLLLGTAACATKTAAGDKLTVYCFSAGKADAILLTTKETAVLIDTGEASFGGTIADYLKKSGITRLDALVITHFDKDHVGGAAKVLETVDVGATLVSNCEKNSDEYAAFLRAAAETGVQPETLREPRELTLGALRLTVYPPEAETFEKDPSNNSSLITAAYYGGTSFLFTGDAQNDRIAEFLTQCNARFDYLKVPYHGHWQKNLTLLTAAVQPRWAVITCSDEEPEDEKTVALLESAGAEVFLTRTAPVIAVSDGSSVTVRYE